MGHRFEEVNLSNGSQVTLVHWEDLSPTRHGSTLTERAWTDSDTRASLSFYDSTAEYMHNDWAQANMAPRLVEIPDVGAVRLCHNAQTDTWHSADALDIDHVSQWKDHFETLGVANHADANMAYNDVSNLRLLPAPINRARESAFRTLEQHGPDSPQWREWVGERFGFDIGAERDEYQPDRDSANRTRTTLEQDWSPDDGRKGLSFDAAVLGKWYQSRLAESYVATVELEHPVSKAATQVPLFRCAASGQLCTRDAFDIDHHIPFELLSAKMAEHAGHGGLSKADALDGYNETSNLRLVGRSVNSSHEYEMDESGQYRDEEEPERPGEFDGFLASDDEDVELTAQLKSELRALGRDYRVPDLTVDHRDHRDHDLYTQAWDRLGDSDAARGMSGPERRNAAGALALIARNWNLERIDAVTVGGADRSSLFAMEGDPPHGKYAYMPIEDAKRQTLEQSTLGLNKLAQERDQQQGQQQGQQPNRSAMMQ